MSRASYSRKEFSERHNIPLRTLDRYIAQGRIPSTKIGRHVRILAAAEAPQPPRIGTKVKRDLVGEEA